MSQPKIIVVHSKKGGSTKTSTAVNIAGALVELGKVVYINDFDRPYGGATAYFGKEDAVERPLGVVLAKYATDDFSKQDLEDSIAEVISYEESEDVGGLYIFPTSDNLTQVEKLLEGEEYIVGNFLEEHLSDLVPEPDFVFLDCPPTTDSSLVEGGIMAADYVLVPCKPNQLDLAAVEGTLAWLNGVTGKESISDDGHVRYGFVINLVKENRKNRYMDLIYESEAGDEVCLETFAKVFPYIREHDALGDDVPSSGLPVTTYIRKLREEKEELIARKEEIDSDIEELTRLYNEASEGKGRRKRKGKSKSGMPPVTSRGAKGNVKQMRALKAKKVAEAELETHEFWMNERLPAIKDAIAEAIPGAFDYMNLTRHVSQEIDMGLDGDILAWLRKYTPEFESYNVELTKLNEKGEEVFKNEYTWLEGYVRKVERKAGRKTEEVYEWTDLSEEDE